MQKLTLIPTLKSASFFVLARLNDSIFFSQIFFQKLFIKTCYNFFIRQRREKQIAALNFSDHFKSDTISKDQILNKKFPTKKSKKSPTIALTIFLGRNFFFSEFHLYSLCPTLNDLKRPMPQSVFLYVA